MQATRSRITRIGPLSQIVGFRKDRLGARLMALGNLLRLQADFDTTVHYIWPSSFEAHDMSIGPGAPPIFDPDFQAEYIRMVPGDDRSAPVGRTELDLIAPRTSTERFAARLAEGETFVCAASLSPLRFMNESTASAAAAFHAAMGKVRFADPIMAALHAAEAALDALGPQRVAIHLRRGDVVSGDPWRHRAWTSKFAPDEFYAPKLSGEGVAAVVFSDTPAAAERMCRAFPNARRLQDLAPLDDLSTMQRDLVELLLMARCAEIVAPVLSGFSAVAAAIGGLTVFGLPTALPPATRRDAYDKLFERVLEGPERFLNSGDFAQSLSYAHQHSLNAGGHRPLFARTLAALDDGAPEALLLPIGMALAIACGDMQRALALHGQARAHPDLWQTDLELCDGLALLARHHAGETRDSLRAFLQLHVGRRRPEAAWDALAGYFFAKAPELRSLFMLDASSLRYLTEAGKPARPVLFPASDCAIDASATRQVPLWINVGDWPEMFDRPKLAAGMRAVPSLFNKTQCLPPEIVAAELKFYQSGAPLPTDGEALVPLSLLSVALMLGGAYRRAIALMFHCRNSLPSEPIYLKRLANQFLLMNNPDRALLNLERAAAQVPDHPGLALAIARLRFERKDHAGAAALCMTAVGQDLAPPAVYDLLIKSLRRLGSTSAAADVKRRALDRFPNHYAFAPKAAAARHASERENDREPELGDTPMDGSDA